MPRPPRCLLSIAVDCSLLLRRGVAVRTKKRVEMAIRADDFPAIPRLRHVRPPVALAYGLPTCRGRKEHLAGGRCTVDVRCTRSEIPNPQPKSNP